MGSQFSAIFSPLVRKELIIIGLVGKPKSGTSTILTKLDLGAITSWVEREDGSHIESLRYKNILFSVLNLGWDSGMSSILSFLFNDSLAIVFVIDSTDREHIDWIREDFEALYKRHPDSIFLFLANKQDLPEAMSLAEITEKYGLDEICDHKWHLQATCAISGEGLSEGFEWLVTSIVDSMNSN